MTTAHPSPTTAPHTTRVGSRLLAAADELFQARGIAAVGVDLLAEHAGTTKRTLYQRFGSKDGLVAAYLTARASEWQHSVLNALEAADSATGLAGIDVVLDVAEERVDGQPRGCAFVNAWAELVSTESSALEVIAAEKRWMHELFVALLGSPSVASDVQLVYEGAHVARSVAGDKLAYRRASRVIGHLLAEPLTT